MSTLPLENGFDPTDTEVTIRKFMEDGNVPGLFVAVVKGESVLYERSFGFADVEKKIPMTSESCTELGSISKAFTAEVIYHLNHKGLLKLDQPVTDFLTEAPSSWSEITIRQLLSHTSGIQNYLLDPRFKAADYFIGDAPDSEEFFDTVSSDSMTRMFYSLPVEFTPGTSWSYSNTGYFLLGKIVEKVTGRKFFELAEEVVTAPLGMTHTKPNEISASEGCLAKGYIEAGDNFRTSHVLTSNYAFSAGAWATNGHDMVNFLKAIHLRKLPSDESGYDWRIPRHNSELPFTYEGGRFYSSYHGMRIISHNGGTPGFSSSWIYLTEKNISIIVLINKQDYAAIDQFARDVLSAFEPSLKYPVNELKGHAESELSESLMQIVNAVRNNSEFPPVLSDPLKIFLNSNNGKGLWQWYFARGFPKEAYCVDVEDDGSFRTCRFLLPCSDNVMYRMTLVLNNRDQIVQMLHW
jgi:CubicO group peptidase (beta-lactamase class C family)